MKKIIILICTIFLIIILCLGYAFLNNKEPITKDEAKKIAMNDVSNKDNEYFFDTIEYNQKDNIYILTFSDQNNYYTYKINAKNKKILSSKKESLINNKSYLSDEEILKIVFSHASLNRIDCNLISNLVTLENGTPFYNTTFYHKSIRYDYKVNAYTGSILSVIKLDENAK